MEKFEIAGKIAYQDIGPGFWGVVGEGGEQWRPVNLPEKLKKEGLPVKLTVKYDTDDVSIFMWGESVTIV